MSRFSQMFVVLFAILFSTMAFVMGDEDPAATSETEAPARPRVKISPDAYPYGKPKEATGVSSSTPLLSWLLHCSTRSRGEESQR